MRPPPAVTVVIPTHNRRPLLAEAIASLRAQVGIHWEAVIVDDASTDDTWDWLQRIDDPRITVHRQSRTERQAVARNLGLESVHSHYCLFLDDDDLLWPDALRCLFNALDRDGRAVAAIGARQDWFTAQGYRRRDVHPWRSRRVNLNRPLLAGWSAVPGQILFRTAIVRRVGGYNKDLVPCEDRDLLHKIARTGDVLLLPHIVMTYRITPDQWRPTAISEIRERVARQALLALPAAQRRSGLRSWQMVRLVDTAEDRCCQGSALQAVTLLARAFLAAPATLMAPMIGPWVMRRLAGRLARRLWPAQPSTRHT